MCLCISERPCLGALQGLLEMMESKMGDWSNEFIGDIKALCPELPLPAPTPAAPSSALVARYTGEQYFGRRLLEACPRNGRSFPAAHGHACT